MSDALPRAKPTFSDKNKHTKNTDVS